MADPISAAAAAVAQWVYAAAFAAAGSTTAAAATLANVAYLTAYAVTYVGLTAGVTMGLTAIARSSVPDPEGQKITRKQPRPPRVHAVGWDSRMSGPYMLRETVGNKYGAVIALCDDRLDAIPRVYLNDDEVTLNGSGWVQGMDNGRYGTGDLVNISLRLGLPGEVRHANLDPTFSGYWATNARGDGVASLAVFAQHRSKESFAKHFPNGEVIPSIVGRPVCYDWRDPAQIRSDESTWKACANPIVWLVHVEWARHGRSWPRCIAPVLEDLTIEADYCDTLVPLKAGGFEPRYRLAGNYPTNTEPAAVREAILSTMDGWLSVNGKGHLIVRAGRYVEPAFVLTEEHVEGYSWRAFQTDEETVNELIVSYVSPDQAFTEIEAGAWRDEDDISATGRLRSEPLGLTWVFSRSQAMRLAKRKMTRLNALRRGQIRTGIYGLNGLGQRYIRVQNSELISMADVVCEVTNVEIDFAASQVVFDVIQADVQIDAWNPVEEEGEQPAAIIRPDPVPSDQEAARLPIGRSTPFPTSATTDTITITAYQAFMSDGVTIDIPAGSIGALTASITYGVFWKASAGFATEASPATGHMTSGSWVFIGWQSTADGSGGYPSTPTPPGGWGGTGGSAETVSNIP